MTSHLRPATVLFIAMTLLCGIVYPLVVTGIGQIVFSKQVAGSLIERHGKAVGSHLIGQSFSSSGYFWGRPSATSPMPNNGAGSGGSNLGPLNPAQTDAVKGRLDALKAADTGNSGPVPVDLVTASASGLDPDISVAAAEYQVRRVAAARHIEGQALRDLIETLRQKQWFGFFGEPAVNVLELNLALDAMPAAKNTVVPVQQTAQSR